MKDKIETTIKAYQLLREKLDNERDAELERAKKSGANSSTLENIEREFTNKKNTSYERHQVDKLLMEIKGNKENEELLNQIVGKIML